MALPNDCRLQKLFNFMSFHLLTVGLNVCAVGVLLRKTEFKPVFFLLFHQTQDTGLVLRSLNHSELSSVQGDEHGSVCVRLHAALSSDQHRLLKVWPLLEFVVLVSLSKIRIHRCVELCLYFQSDSTDQLFWGILCCFDYNSFIV